MEVFHVRRRGTVAIVVSLVATVICGVTMLHAQISGEEATLWAQASAEKVENAQRVALLDKYLQTYPTGHYKAQANALMAVTAVQLGMNEKVIASGEEALKADPDSIQVLLALAKAYSAQPATYAKSLAHSDHAVQVCTKKMAEQPPAGITPEQWKTEWEKFKKRATWWQADVKGLSAIAAKNYEGAIESLNAAYKMYKDQKTAYLLGSCYQNLAKLDEAISFLCEAVNLPGGMKAQAQEKLEKLYKAKHQSLDGLQQKIDEAKARVQQ